MQTTLEHGRKEGPDGGDGAVHAPVRRRPPAGELLHLCRTRRHHTYAAKLHGLGPFVWVFRIFMGAMLAVHVVFGVLLTLENSAANPGKYAVKKMLKATFASETRSGRGCCSCASSATTWRSSPSA